MRRLLTSFALTVALSFAAQAQQAPPERVGNFTVTSSTDPITDEQWVFASARDLQRGDSRVTFGVACLGTTLYVVIQHPTYGGDSDYRIRVTFRFDDGEIITNRWSLWVDSRASSLPLEELDGFVAQSRQSERVALSVVDPFDGETHRAVISLTGFGDAYQRVAAACAE